MKYSTLSDFPFADTRSAKMSASARMPSFSEPSVTSSQPGQAGRIYGSKRIILFPATQEQIGSLRETQGREADDNQNLNQSKIQVPYRIQEPVEWVATPPSKSKDRTQFQGRIHLLAHESGRLI